MNKEKKLSANTMAMLIITGAMVLLNILPRFITPMADFYADYIFPFTASCISAVTGLLPFSLGEIMIILGILLLIAAPVLFIAFIVRKKKKLVKIWGIIYCWVLIFILVTETLNCFMLYQTTEFSERYHNSAGSEGFTDKQLAALLEKTILRANELAPTLNRGDDGKIIVPDNMDDIAENAMNILSAEYPPLKGKYPNHKTILFSSVMTRFGIQGVYFPFSLEANVNGQLGNARTPCTIMHELCHLKGFIREDEACFIAYRACLASGVPEVEYSGLLSGINYMYAALKKSDPAEARRIVSMALPQVAADDYFVTKETMEKIEEKAVVSTEVTKAVSDTAIDVTLKANGITDGKKSYGRMTELLLEYHYFIAEDITCLLA